MGSIVTARLLRARSDQSFNQPAEEKTRLLGNGRSSFDSDFFFFLLLSPKSVVLSLIPMVASGKRKDPVASGG